MRWSRTIAIHIVVLLVSILLTIVFALTMGGATLASICFLVACATAVSLVWTLTRRAAQRRNPANITSA